MDIEKAISEIQTKFGVVGREGVLRKLILAKAAGKHIVVEGPVGVGKTTLAHAIAAYFDQGFIRIDGDERYTESKLVGHFEPPLVVEKGWVWDAFVPGPLTLSMKNGSILFINEANRLIEGTQNVLLPSMDEGILILPKLGVIKAGKGFLVVATQNPESYIGTTVLSEALKDRFVWIKLEHQGYEQELDIHTEQRAIAVVTNQYTAVKNEIRPENSLFKTMNGHIPISNAGIEAIFIGCSAMIQACYDREGVLSNMLDAVSGTEAEKIAALKNIVNNEINSGYPDNSVYKIKKLEAEENPTE